MKTKKHRATISAKKKVKIEKGFLSNFIKNRIAEYDEPTRKGTRKGSIVGLSKKKYSATLWLLSNFTVDEIAKKVGVSQGLLRKWKTENQFKEKIWEDEEAYLQYHKAKRKEVYTIMQDHFNNPERIDRLTSDRELDDYDDFSLYNPSLILDIVESIMRGLENNCKYANTETFSFIYCFDLILELVFNEPVITLEQRRKSRELLRLLIDQISYHQRAILSVPKYSDEQRKKALILAIMIQNYGCLLVER